MITDFDELYVVSDLHLGGDDDFQIFEQGDTLARLIHAIRERATPSRRVGLVLNGDIVDFLAMEHAPYFDPWHAQDSLRAVMKDPAFKPVFEALSALVGTSSCHLVLVLGNHDIELALPAVRSMLSASLANGAWDAQRRFSAAVDGTGYRCSVGGAEVLCVHGNEVDVFNRVDHTALLKCARAMNRQTKLDDLSPNVGTTVVIDIMNDLKKRYRWIDLLKPVGKGVVPLLLAIDPKAVRRKLAEVPRLAPALARAGWNRYRGERMLGSADDTEDLGPDAGLVALFGDLAEAGSRAGASVALDEIEREVEEALRKGLDGLDLLGGGGGEGALLLPDGRWVVREITKASTRQLLRLLLGSRAPFNDTKPDETFRRLDELVGSEIDFLISGHTHARKALRRLRGPGYYFNCGTWITQIELDDHVLEDSDAFDELWEALGEYKGIEPLRRLGVVKHEPTVVRIQVTRDGVEGALCDVKAAGETSATLAPAEGCVYRVTR